MKLVLLITTLVLCIPTMAMELTLNINTSKPAYTTKVIKKALDAGLLTEIASSNYSTSPSRKRQLTLKVRVITSDEILMQIEKVDGQFDHFLRTHSQTFVSSLEKQEVKRLTDLMKAAPSQGQALETLVLIGEIINHQKDTGSWHLVNAADVTKQPKRLAFLFSLKLAKKVDETTLQIPKFIDKDWLKR